MAGRLQIGPVEWKVQSSPEAEMNYSDPAYDGFWKKDSDLDLFPPLISVSLSVSRQACTIPDGEPLYSSGKNWAMWEEGRDLIFCAGYYDQPAARYYCRLHRDSGEAELFLDPARAGEDPSPYESPLVYPIDQVLSWGLLASCGGIILHSSVAVKDGMVWVFSGRSGAGKSTIAELCHQDGWQILNDDRVIVFKRDGAWRVAGTPWHGSGRFSAPDEVPLGGLFFIDQSDQDQAEPIANEAVRYKLLDVAAVPWFEEEWSQQSLDVVDRFAEEGVFCGLKFTRRASAVQAVKDCIAQLGGVSV